MPFNSAYVLPVAASLALALVLTPLVRAFARKTGMVAKPKTDRWHKKRPPMLGGVAIWLSVTITYLVFLPHTPYSLRIMIASTFLFTVGLFDDLVHIKPYQKLVGQIMGSAYIIYYGMTLPWTTFSFV